MRPKVVTSVHYCPTTSKSSERNYSDLTSLEAYPSTAAYPTQDDDGNPLQTEYGLSTYKDHQTLTIQELPEKAPTGQLVSIIFVYKAQVFLVLLFSFIPSLPTAKIC